MKEESSEKKEKSREGIESERGGSVQSSRERGRVVFNMLKESGEHGRGEPETEKKKGENCFFGGRGERRLNYTVYLTTCGEDRESESEREMERENFGL